MAQMLLTQRGKTGWWLVVVEKIVPVSGGFGAGLVVVAVIVVATEAPMQTLSQR